MKDKTELGEWRRMAKAPKDGTRIIAIIRQSEQGAADVDVVRWSHCRQRADECWMSADSSFDCPISYEDWEVAFWMPLPSTMPAMRTPGMASKLPAFPHDGEEIGGSGI